MNKIYYCILTFFLLFVSNLEVAAQSDTDLFRITSIKPDDSDRYLNVMMSIPSDRKNIVNANTVKFLELLPSGEKCTFRIISFSEDIPDDIKKDTVTILFLLDYSGSMRIDDRLEKSKETIHQVVEKIRLLPGSSFNLSVFNNDITETVRLKKSNVTRELSKFPEPTLDTDLYRATIEKIQELIKTTSGKKVLILLSDGTNDTGNNPYYNELGNKRFTAKDVYEQIKMADLSSEILVMTYGIGDGVDKGFLTELPDLTEATDDNAFFTDDIDEITDDLMRKLSVYSSDFLFKLKPMCNEYRGELRQMGCRWTKANGDVYKDMKKYQFGSSIEPMYIGAKKSQFDNWFVFLALGVFLVFGLLFLLIYILPKIKRQDFIRKHVKKYVPEPGKIKRDPITQDIFQEGDRVVSKCRQLTSLETWDALGHCPNFPNCMEFQDPCNGSGGEEMEVAFFSQRGKTKLYNWMWFGSLGGLIGWILYTGLFELSQMEGLARQAVEWFPILDPKISSSGSAGKVPINASTLVQQFFQGGLLGTALIGTLTFAEELGQTRKISYGRIAIRILLAIILSFALFGVGFFFQYQIVNNIFLSGLINWAIYGLILGIVLSISSSIEWKKGLIGGIISCTISYLAYYGIGQVIVNDMLAKLLSFILLGGVLGALIVTVLSSLENFELIYLSPKEYNGMVKPISKWLKSGMEVYIGASAKCYVFIKWNDESVEDKHAMLVYDDNRVHIIALEETLVNGEIIPENQKTMLYNNDIIQLGTRSISKMQYKEK